MKTKIKHIAIIGLGLIGGSLAKALKAKGYKIVGITKSLKTIKQAKKEKAINIGYTKLSPTVFKNIDLIFIATPLNLIPLYIRKISKTVKHEVVLTDVGSTKSEICNFAKKALPKNITFIGGHPMAGNENSGFSFAQKSLFKNCAWILTPQDKSKKTKEALKTLNEIIKQIGAKPVITDLYKHDKAVALISHLPLVASIGLCEVVKKLKDHKLQNLAILTTSSGFRDTTRIAGGNPEMNSNLIISNFKNLSGLLSRYNNELKKIIRLAKKNPKKFRTTLVTISKWRNNLYNQTSKLD